MALIDKKILNPIRYHQDNSNIILNQASAMKSLFDQGAEDLRVRLNGVIDELLATTGAQQIGIDPAKGLGNTLADALTNIKNYMNLGASGISATTIGTGSGNTVQSQLEWLLLQIQNVLLNQIPDGTITMQKLATALANTINGNTSNIGDLATLTTTEKTNLVGAVNELVSQSAQMATERGYITSKTLTSADNLNDVVSNGKYWCNGALNYPETQEQGFLDVITFGTNFVSQKFAVNGSSSDYFLRNRVSGVWAAWKKVSYAVTPVETVITSGFESGWSGEIRLSKTQENILIIEIIQLVKTTDITANEIVYRLPLSPINFRPKTATRHAFVGQSQDTNILLGSMVEVVLTTDGYIRLKNLGTITAGVRSCSYVTIVQMGGL